MCFRRVPGDIDCVNFLKIQLDKWQAPKDLKDPHAPASLLKLWFREMYEPLIPQRFYDQCIHNCDNPDVCLNIVSSLPAINNIVFSYLVRLLQVNILLPIFTVINYCLCLNCQYFKQEAIWLKRNETKNVNIILLCICNY